MDKAFWINVGVVLVCLAVAWAVLFGGKYVGATTCDDQPLVEDEPLASNETLDAIYSLSANIESDWANELGLLIEAEFTADRFPDVKNPVLLAIALCYCESSFNPLATNPSTKCAGLFQLHPMHGYANIYDPATNVMRGAEKLEKYIADKGSLRGGLRRYGTASGKVLRIYNNLMEDEDGSSI